MLNSPILPAESEKRLRSSLTRHHKNDLVRIPSTDKFEDINNNHYDEAENTSNDCQSRDAALNDPDNEGTLLTTTTTTTVEVKVKTTKTSSRKRKLNGSNDITGDNMNKQQPVAKKRKNARMIQLDEKPSPTKNDSQTVDQAAGTDESAFGSCEPGTSVVLQGIVWNETDKGVLVVNITWRGKTYVGALLNTTEQNWAPPRYKSDVRSTKQNHNRDQQLTSIPSTHDSTERILRNGKRRGSSTTVTPSSATKNHSFKIPPTPRTSSKTDDALSVTRNTTDEDETNSLVEEKRNATSSNGDDEIGDNDSSRSLSPTTSGTSTTSSSPPLSANAETHLSSSTAPMAVDLSSSKATSNIEQKPNDSLIPYHFPREMMDPSSYFSSRHGPSNSFALSSFNKLSSQPPSISSPSSFLPIPAQLYFNSLTLPHYSSVPSLSKSSH